MYRERDKGAGKEAKRRLILHRITHDEKRGTMASFAGSSEEQAEAAAVLQRVEERCDAAESAVNAMLPQFEAFGMTDLHGAVLADHEAHASDKRPIIANLVAAVRELRDAEAAREVAERNDGDASSVSAVVLKQLIEDKTNGIDTKISKIQAMIEKKVDARLALMQKETNARFEAIFYLLAEGLPSLPLNTAMSSAVFPFVPWRFLSVITLRITYYSFACNKQRSSTTDPRQVDLNVVA